MAVFQVNLG